MSFRWTTVMIKMSGEALAGQSTFGLEPETVASIARQVSEIREMGLNVCLTVGGGNIFRGSHAPRQIQRVTGDYMGMLATVINGLALCDVLKALGSAAELYSAVNISPLVKAYTRRDALDSLKEGKIVIFSAGTGRPYFTTDTSAVVAALEMNCDLLVKATNVDGVFSADPRKNQAAEKYNRLSYREVIDRDLRVMDLTAITLLKEHNLPLMVFNISTPGNLAAMARGDMIGTYLSNDPRPIGT
jgi:uridylate kinase